MPSLYLPQAGRGSRQSHHDYSTPCLWFDTEAQDAANFYLTVIRELGNTVR